MSQPYSSYPGQPPYQGYPGQTQQGYPGQTQQGYPGQTQQGYPGHQGYPGQTHQGYPGQPQQGFPNQPGYGAPGIDPNVVSWFRAVDQDNSGHINSKELQAALQNGNRSHFSDEACRMMIGMFDMDHSGTMNIQEFSQLFNYISQWTEVYKRYDQDKSGTIDEREMATALQQMGYRLSPQFVSHLVAKFAPKTRKITLDNFIVSNVQIHKLTEMFKAKDREMKGVVTLGYEEFMSMAISV